uniref:Putative salivary lipocalin n=1 Tax=Ornithodoros turicata TaxID=34597 RepID=A0A2R5L5U9_9ACAR
MHLKLVTVVFCVIAAEFVLCKKRDQTKNKDVWEIMKRSDVFFLVRRTYRWSADRSVCSYIRVLEKDKGNKTLLTLSGNYNTGTTDYNKHKIYVTTRKGKGRKRNHMLLSTERYNGPGFEYKAIFDDGEGCSILKIAKITQEKVPQRWVGQCEMWATNNTAYQLNVTADCEVKYFKMCKPNTTIEDTPYVINCKEPPKDMETSTLPEC